MFEGETKLMEPQAGAQPGVHTASPTAKFWIGLLAGVSAVLLPRVLASVTQGDGLDVVFLPAPYFLLALGAGLFIGLVMLVLEYGVPAKPRETFMAALGIPAILTGALGTASSAGSAKELAAEAAQLRQAVAQQQGIGKAGAFGELQPLDAPAAPPPARTSLLPSFIASAHAADGGAAPADPVRFGVRLEQPRYVVVLKQSATADEARAQAEALKKQIPTAQAVRANGSYFVVLGGAPTGETDALLAATRAKHALGGKLQPVLVEIRR